ncbi:hypothetical protein ACP70R_039396 [Stipagrostis hirtigluma subsp. patula]
MEISHGGAAEEEVHRHRIQVVGVPPAYVQPGVQPEKLFSDHDERARRIDRLLGDGPAEDRHKSMAARAAALCRALGLLPPEPIRPGQPLTEAQFERLQNESRRFTIRGHFEILAATRKLALKCLSHYNSANPGEEYELAPGALTSHVFIHNAICWTHGNFVARRKRSGFFSFLLPAPRTLFFFELTMSMGFERVVTCTPLLDEPVTEAYNVLGFPLWWSTRRSGRMDCICKTCHRHFDVPHVRVAETFACGHKNVERVCDMCYLSSDVLHPSPGEFAFGYREPYRPYKGDTYNSY